MTQYEEKTQILVSIARLEERMEAGFTGVNRRLDTTNGQLGKHETRLDDLEKLHIERLQPKKFDYRLVILGIVIGAFAVAAGMTIQDVLKLGI